MIEMESITTVTQLGFAIQQLEVEHYTKGEQLKEQLKDTLSSLRPINLIKDAVRDAVSSPYLLEDLVFGVLSLSTGFLAKRMVFGASNNIIKKILGFILQMGVSRSVTHNEEPIKNIGYILYRLLTTLKRSKVSTGNGRN